VLSFEAAQPNLNTTRVLKVTKHQLFHNIWSSLQNIYLQVFFLIWLYANVIQLTGSIVVLVIPFRIIINWCHTTM